MTIVIFKTKRNIRIGLFCWLSSNSASKYGLSSFSQLSAYIELTMLFRSILMDRSSNSRLNKKAVSGQKEIQVTAQAPESNVIWIKTTYFKLPDGG